MIAMFATYTAQAVIAATVYIVIGNILRAMWEVRKRSR